MMDCGKEALLDELSDFERQKPTEIPAVLDEYLCQVAKTGDTMLPWHRLKPLLCRKLEMVMNEFYEAFPTDSLPVLPNVEAFKYEDMKAKILEALDTFTSAPFTIQRLCELVVDPRKHYKRTDKFMRGVEKNVLVVSTVEPKSALAQSQQQPTSTPMVNGVPGIEELGINGHNADEVERTGMHAVDPEQEKSPAKMDAVETVACLEGEPLPYSDSSHTRLDGEKEAADSSDTAEPIDAVPATAEEPTISQAETKEPMAVPAEPSPGKSPCSETQTPQFDNVEETAEKDEAETEVESVPAKVSSTENVLAVEEPASALQKECDNSVADSVAVAAPVVEGVEVENTSSCEKEAEAQEPDAEVPNLGISSKLEKGPVVEDEAGPPLKKFHSEGQVPFEGNEALLDSEQSGAESAYIDAATNESSLPAGNGSGESGVVQNVEMIPHQIEEPSGVLNTGNAPGIAIPESVPGVAIAPDEDEPMDQD